MENEGRPYTLINRNPEEPDLINEAVSRTNF